MREPAFNGELKDILFHHARGELEGYLRIREKHGQKMAEVQRQRYVSLYQVIEQANLDGEFREYKTGKMQ